MDTMREKIGLLIITALTVIGLVTIGLAAIYHGISADAATLVGVVVTGLAAFGKDIVAAIRGYSMSAQLSKVTDQLAASTPQGGDTPQPVTVVNTPAEPVPTTTETTA